VLKLKENNTELKVLLGLHAKSDGSKKISKMTSDPETRKSFIIDVESFIR
jgi:hypothetical protein